MVEGNGLENRRTRKGAGGSNPSSSTQRSKARLFDTFHDGDMAEWLKALVC